MKVNNQKTIYFPAPKKLDPDLKKVAEEFAIDFSNEEFIEIVLSGFPSCSDAKCTEIHKHRLHESLANFLSSLTDSQRIDIKTKIAYLLEAKELTEQDIENLLKTKNKPQASEICTKDDWLKYNHELVCANRTCNGECGKRYVPLSEIDKQKPENNIKSFAKKYSVPLICSLIASIGLSTLAYLALKPNSQNSTENNSDDLTTKWLSSLELSNSLPANKGVSSHPSHHAPNNALTSLQLTNSGASQTN